MHGLHLDGRNLFKRPSKSNRPVGKKPTAVLHQIGDKQLDAVACHVSLHARAWCQCYRGSVDAGGAAVRVCLCGI